MILPASASTTPSAGLRRHLAARLPGVEIDDRDGARDRFAHTTGFRGTRPLAIARPLTTGQVQAVVRAAAELGVSVYPISGGRNWGYGDACAPRDGCLLLDLSRMNRILAVDQRLGYAVLEPGVTQGQLSAWLRERGIPLLLDPIGAGPDASIVGNILDRGIGLSRYADRLANACNFEVVLADGSVVHTGYGGYPQAQAQHLYKAGVGPQLDGIFSQANLGIVTRATVWLMPRPERHETFFIELRSREAIGPFVEALRGLCLSGTVRCSVHAFNDLRLLGGHCRFPWDLADGRRALEDAHPEWLRAQLRRFGIPAWVATGSLTGSKAEVAAARKTIRRALRGVKGARAVFLSPRLVACASWLGRRLRRFGALRALADRIEKIRIWSDFLQGTPSHQTLVGAHWRARGQAGSDQDPRDSGSGLVWVSPAIPMTREAVEEVERLGRASFARHGFEFQTTVSVLSARALCFLMSIQFDRRSAEERQRARACHDELLAALLERGYVPYRGGPETAAFLHDKAPEFWETARRIKDALDPAGVIAPGRYISE